jgi:hypothetical protein
VKSDIAARFRSPRFVLGLALLAVFTYVGLQPFYGRFLFVDRSPWAQMLEAFPDRRNPAYLELVKRAADEIPSGDSVAVLFSTLEWHRGYSYAYFRAQYFLPGRTVVPLGWPAGPQPHRIAEAEWAIVFGTDPPDGEWRVVVSGPGGELLRRAP